ncbi:related to V-type proton ATPase subunit E [Nakaseomyces glabratus]|nr:related to V-type proton ATPase subunit E [Nakaseomyces glabratus]SLM16877.1 related to V-type proton ATPase subunit E [Nakaseomyces glabratus]
MSMITALTPNQVNDELNKMQAFIRKEAEEKAKEIQLKADQEYEIKKTGIRAPQEDHFAAADYEVDHLQQDETEGVELQEESLNDIFDEAKSRLSELVSTGKYRDILVALVVEGMIKLLEPAVVVRLTEKDYKKFGKDSKLIDDIVKSYKDTVKGCDIEVSIAEDNFLQENAIGGCIVSDSEGRIEVNNSLTERLHILSQEALPAIRLEIFGPSKTRKFFD